MHIYLLVLKFLVKTKNHLWKMLLHVVPIFVQLKLFVRSVQKTKVFQQFLIKSKLLKTEQLIKNTAIFLSFLQTEFKKPLLDQHKLLLRRLPFAMIPVLLLAIIGPIVYTTFTLQEPLPMTLVKRNGQALSYSGKVTESENKKVALDLKTNGAALQLDGITTPPKDILVYVDEPQDQTSDKDVITKVLYVDDSNLSFESAKIELHVDSNKKVNAIVRCESWNFDAVTGNCSDWEVTDIVPEQNGKTVAFTVDHFSAYAGAYLEILNVQTNLTVGDVWEKRFNTYGTSDLTIEAIEGTVYGTDVHFIEFYCGETKYPADVYNGSKVFIENYSCDGQLSRLVDRSVTPGRHVLQFTFGETVAIAKNFACDVGTLSDTCEVSTSQAQTNGTTISGSGNLVIKGTGNLSTNAAESFSINMTGNVTIENGGQITGNLTTLTAASLDVQLGGSINSNAKGFASTTGTGQGADSGASQGGGGAGYGGYGGNSSGGLAGGISYGSLTAPTDYGSGGGIDTAQTGGGGGGAVTINVSGTTTVAGTISANGGVGTTNGSTRTAGGGSGGSIYITTGTLAGAGSITANGGAGTNGTSSDAGAGGGGRIALYYTTRTHNGAVQAIGGSGSDSALDGGAGTIYEKPSASSANLTLDNTGRNLESITQLPTGSYTLATFTVSNGTYFNLQDGVTLTVGTALSTAGSFNLYNSSTTGSITYPTYDLTSAGTVAIVGGGTKWPLRDITVSSGTLSLNGAYSVRDVTVATGSVLTHLANTTTQTYDLQLTASGNLSLNGTGSINVDGKGFASTSGTGQGTDGSSGNGGGGGAYGGAGGNGDTGVLGSTTVYGTISAPTVLGSGGGVASSSVGGAGGGAVVLNVTGTVTIAGSISANGGAGSGSTANVSGGGSGGSVYITANTIAGAGSITASGGNGGDGSTADGGAGGGGRIALYYTSKTHNGTVQAIGGTGATTANDGAAGTIYDQPTGQTNATVTIDNGNRTADSFTQFVAGTYTFNTVNVKGNAILDIQNGVTVATTTLNPTANFHLYNSSTTGALTYATPFDLTTTGTSTIIGGTAKWPIRDLTVSSGTLSLNGSYSSRNVVIATGATLTHKTNATTHVYDLRLDLSGDLTLNGTGSINATGKGYTSSSGTGQGSDGASNSGGGGAGYGGGGGNGNGGAAGGTTYGSSTTPADLGSGGGHGSSASSTTSAGGGLIILDVDGTTTIASTASIVANGEPGNGSSFNVSGAGSGGSINLITGVLAGSGGITANGGTGGNSTSADGGGGGGGRVSVFSGTSTYSGTVSVAAGTGPDAATDGATGTTYTDYSAPSVTINTICETGGNSCTGSGAIASPQQAFSVTSISGTATESNTSLTAVQISIKDSTSNMWYNPGNNSFDQSSVLQFNASTISQTLPYTGSVNWTYDATGIPFVIDHSYDFSLHAVNPKVTKTETLQFIFSNSPPTLSSVSASQASNGTVTANYNVTDNEGSSTTVYLFYDIGTTLPAGIDTSTNDITVSNAANFPNSGTILIDDEMITYSGKTSNTLTGISRGALNSTIVSHDSSDVVAVLSSNTTGNIGTVSNGTGKSITWNAKTDLNGFYSATAKVIIVSNDGASSQMVDAVSTSSFSLDVKNPTWTGNLVVNASVADPTITVPCADDSTLEMKIGLTSNLADVSWQAFDSSTTVSEQSLSVADPIVLYAQCKDNKTNTSTIETVSVPQTPSNLFYQDVSNTGSSEYRLFLAWSVIDDPAAGFSQYIVYRKVDAGAYAQLTTISDRNTNYILDTGLSNSSAYSYKVVAVDADGNISHFSSVITDTPDGSGGSDITPPTLTSVTSTSVSTTQATITWNTNKLSNSTVYYKASNSYPGSNKASYDTTQGVPSMVTGHSVVLTNLTPNTKYYFLVESEDASENTGSSASSTYNFTTTAGPIISGVTIPQVYDTEATISWTTNIAASSTVIYSTNSNLSSSTTVNGSGGNSTGHTVVLTGLSAGTKYYFQVKSVDVDSNISIDSNVIDGVTTYYSLTTTSDSVGPVISNLAVALIATDGVTITWQTNEVATSQLLWDTDNVLNSSTTQTSVYTNQHAVTLTDLDPDTTYYYQAVSRDKSGNATSSTPIASVTTTADNTVPGDSTDPIFSNIDVTSITSKSAVVTWLTDENTDSFVKHGTASDNLDTTVGKIESVTSHSVTINGLTASTTYYFAATGRDAEGNVGESSVASFTTAASTNEELENAEETDNELVSLVVSIVEKASKTFLEKVLAALVKNPSISSLSEDKVIGLVEDLSDKSISAPSLSAAVDVEPGADTALVRWTTNKPANSMVAYATEDEYKPDNEEAYATEAGDSQAYSTDHEVTLTGLKPNTVYHIQARSKDRFGPVAFSTDAVFTTTALTAEIQDLNLTSANETSVIISWKTSIPTRRSVALVDIDTGEENLYADGSFVKTHTFEAKDLSPSSSYIATISVFDEAGEVTTSPPTPFSTITTSTPPEINDVKVVTSLISGKVEKVQSIISWKTNKPASSTIKYQQGVKADDSAQVIVEETLTRDHIVITTAFAPGQVYKYRVVSTDLAGNTSESQDFTLLTPKPKESVVDLIVNNVEEMFGFLRR